MYQDLEFDHFSHAANALEHAEGTAVDQTVAAQLHRAGESKRVLVLGVSHVGGHKWAGLMQVNRIHPMSPRDERRSMLTLRDSDRSIQPKAQGSSMVVLLRTRFQRLCRALFYRAKSCPGSAAV